MASRAVAGLLLVASVALPAILLRGKSVTFDEVAHLPAGYSYLATGEVRLNAQHPPLVKLLCALPLLALDLDLTAPPEAFRQASLPFTQWSFGRRFLAQDPQRIVFWGRLPAVLLAGGLALLTALWARRLFGTGGALLALALHVLDPTLTAHAQLVTTDVGLAFTATLFLFVLRRYVDAPSALGLAACGGCLGLALGTKYSALVLLPVAALLLALARWRVEAADPRAERLDPGGRAARLLASAAALLGMGAVAWGVLWALHLFPADPFFYLRRMAEVSADHRADFEYYFAGTLQPGGRFHYLAAAALLKTPLATLVLALAAAVAWVRGVRASRLDEAFLWVPALAFFAFYSLASDNLGVRYLIPCFPFLAIFTARLAPAAVRAGRRARLVLVAALAWLAVAYVGIWPDHLSYFNTLAGGASRGYLWLDDSNVDWGQGLEQLRAHLDRFPEDEGPLAYFGSADPAWYGIHAPRVGLRALLEPPRGGTLIASSHQVARARALLAKRYGDGPRNWLAHREPDAVVGHAYHVYRARGGPGSGAEPGAP